jgi:hypothetical protein
MEGSDLSAVAIGPLDCELASRLNGAEVDRQMADPGGCSIFNLHLEASR